MNFSKNIELPVLKTTFGPLLLLFEHISFNQGNRKSCNVTSYYNSETNYWPSNTRTI